MEAKFWGELDNGKEANVVISKIKNGVTIHFNSDIDGKQFGAITNTIVISGDEYKDLVSLLSNVL